MNMRAYRDGSRLVLVIDEPDSATENMVASMLVGNIKPVEHVDAPAPMAKPKVDTTKMKEVTPEKEKKVPNFIKNGQAQGFGDKKPQTPAPAPVVKTEEKPIEKKEAKPEVKPEPKPQPKPEPKPMVKQEIKSPPVAPKAPMATPKTPVNASNTPVGASTQKVGQSTPKKKTVQEMNVFELREYLKSNMSPTLEAILRKKYGHNNIGMIVMSQSEQTLRNLALAI